MMESVTRIDFRDPTETLPALAVIPLMCFTFNIAVGITAGFILYPLCKLAAGKRSDIRPGMWALAAVSLLFFAFYPYS
jgi:AGZA family xanthine/uracil permease-like MFS transporter